MINSSLIEKRVAKDDGWVGRCPACAEGGADTTGNHLRVWGDGRFACVVNPGKEGAQHRKRIFALIGVKEGRNNSRFAKLPPPKVVIPGLGEWTPRG